MVKFVLWLMVLLFCFLSFIFIIEKYIKVEETSQLTTGAIDSITEIEVAIPDVYKTCLVWGKIFEEQDGTQWPLIGQKVYFDDYSKIEVTLTENGVLIKRRSRYPYAITNENGRWEALLPVGQVMFCEIPGVFKYISENFTVPNQENWQLPLKLFPR